MIKNKDLNKLLDAELTRIYEKQKITQNSIDSAQRMIYDLEFKKLHGIEQEDVNYLRQKLLKDNYIEEQPAKVGFRLKFEGIEHLKKGGYVAEFNRSKRKKYYDLFKITGKIVGGIAAIIVTILTIKEKYPFFPCFSCIFGK